MKKVLLFIPAYNCGRQIRRVFSRFTLENLKAIDEILVLDNCSTDDTLAVVQDIAPSFRLKKLVIQQNPSNLGFGGSHKRAFQYALDHGFDSCVVLHGDDQARLDDFIPYLEGAKSGAGEFILGSRFSWRSQTFNYSKVRILGNVFFSFLASILTGRRIADLGGSGLNLYSLPAMVRQQECLFQSCRDDLTFHTALLLKLVRNRADLKFVPIRWYEEDQISNVRMISQTKTLIALLYSYAFGR